MDILQKLIHVNEAWVERGLQGQVMDEQSRYYGGVIDPANGIAWPNHHAGTPVWMSVWTAALVQPESVYYRNMLVLERLELAAAYMLRVQHEDGSISPGWTNFHSPPDTAFVIVGYAQLYLLLSRENWAAAEPTLVKMNQFLERSMPVMLTGGCHTPNHRWVISAALGFLHEIFGDERLRKRAQMWVAEGLDATPDGEWTERSNGIYNAVSDVMLIHASRLLHMPELLEPVRRNLEMMMYLIHPSGEVVTDYSGRQDFGQTFTMDSYLLSYVMIAEMDHNAQFAAMAQLAAAAFHEPSSCANNPLIGMLLYPVNGQSVQPGELPRHYRRMINGTFDRQAYLDQADAHEYRAIQYSRPHLDFGAPVLRMRHGNTSLTMMTETSSLLALRHGDVRLLGVQLASYFNPGFVPMQTLVETESGYRMTALYHKGYRSPIPAPYLPEHTGIHGESRPWYILPHAQRESTHTQAYRVEVETVEQVNGLDLYIRCSDPAEVMTQLSFIFGNESQMIAEDGQLREVSEGVELWQTGMVRIQHGDDWVELTGGAYEHWATAVREASYPSNCRTLLVNLMTPFEHKISLRLSPCAQAEREQQMLQQFGE
ncbi:hypothetical protein [Paenibacillus sp. WLX2291]|uniref:hypothetical protein n=1 Tax=Paenibacillus sp. WLX2291 TaxID=3296934 RepID=UPI003983E4E1